MARYRHKYKGTAMAMRWQRQRRNARWVFGIVAVMVVAIVSTSALSNGTLAIGLFGKGRHNVNYNDDAYTYKRLQRSHIPPVNVAGYRVGDFVDLLPDINDVQLEAAHHWGLIPPIQADGIENNEQLVRIGNNSLYVVDTLWHSMPYLVPAAAVLLNYIGERFYEIMQERNHDGHTYRPIVTSVLRTTSDVQRLRRNNRNATENSCHCYGTTFDITYSRFLRDDGEEIQEYWLRDILAIALYELRYEGLCYVRYEVHQPCFHITVRDVEYQGSLPHSTHSVSLHYDSEPVVMAKPEPRPDDATPQPHHDEHEYIFY
ncbi:MAG: hypothetical protein II793_06010 [Bacteroidales bacterium]|nr:hypothetical protein [Bacteroidales bacterium]